MYIIRWAHTWIKLIWKWHAFANVSLDFGCRQVKMQFPVKLTEPVTAILYISPDKKHLDDLRHAIHVHEVGEGKLSNFQLLHCLRVIFGVTLLAETSSLFEIEHCPYPTHPNTALQGFNSRIESRSRLYFWTIHTPLMCLSSWKKKYLMERACYSIKEYLTQ